MTKNAENMKIFNAQYKNVVVIVKVVVDIVDMMFIAWFRMIVVDTVFN